MTDLEFNEWLRDALEQAALEETAPLLAAGEAAAPAWSRRYLKRRTKLLADPFAYAKRASRPAWKRALAAAGRVAACLALVTAVTLAVSPAARAWASRVLRSWFPDHVTYRFTQFVQLIQPRATRWRPTYIPEGYELTDTFEPSPGHGSLTYTKSGSDDDYIYVSYYFTRIVSSSPSFDNEHSDLTSAQVNGVPADLYVSNTPGWPSHLIWTTAEQDILFYLSGHVDSDTLIRVGESLEKVP